jgi:DNA-binding transcriptional ArsR family regulator
MPELSQFTAEFFKVLAHPLRVRIMDALRSGEIAVNDLSSRLKVEQSTLSQQLAILRKSNVVTGRKEGQNVYYSIQDQAIFRVLDAARQVFNNHLIDIKDLLEQLSPAAEK